MNSNGFAEEKLQNESTFLDDILRFSSASHANHLLSTFQALRSENLFCDVVVKVGSCAFSAHKVVLGASSPYFKSLFTNDLSEALSKSQKDRASIDLQLASPDVFKSILDYIYSGNIDITQDNVQDILSFADMYQIDGLIAPCEAFLKTQLHPSNVLGIFLFAESHSLLELTNASEAYIYYNFLQIIEQDEYFKLPKETLLHILESENLRVENEFQVFTSVICWILHDVVSRRRLLFELLRPIRFALISQRQIAAHVDSLEDFSLRIALRKLLQDFKTFSRGKIWLEAAFAPNLVGKFSPHLLVPRKSAKKSLYVIAGYQRQPGQRWSDSEALRTVEQLDTYKQEWHQMAPMRYPRNGHSAAAVGRFIYVIGGESDSLIYDTVEKYDCDANKWSIAASMTVPRCNHGIAALDDNIYALGGWVGSEIGSTVERFDPKNNSWQVYGTLPQARYGFGIVAHGGLIYVVGGCNDVHEVLVSVDSFNPFTKEWTSLSPMSTPRCFFSLVSLEDRLYAVGGQTGPSEHDTALSTCEVYFPERDEWTKTEASLPSPRAGHSAVAINGCLYVVGGRDNGSSVAAPTTLSSVDRFDPETKKWTRLSVSMIESHCEAAAVLI